MKMAKESLLRMARGALEERVDYEMSAVVENITDVNTKPDAKRKITITLEFLPDTDRSNVQVRATAKSALAPTNPVSTVLYLSRERGDTVVTELVAETPGQMAIVEEGEEREVNLPKIMKLAGAR